MDWRPTWDMATVPDNVFWAEWSRRVALKRDVPPRAKALRSRPHYGGKFGARDLRAHLSKCSKRG